MKLQHLAIGTIAVCLLGLGVLLVFAVHVSNDIRQAHQAMVGVAASALVFGLLCVAASALLQRRVAGPIRHMSNVIHALERGNTQARVQVRGSDELAMLGARFNQLLDQQDRTRFELQAYREILDERIRVLAESQRIAGVGNHRLHIPTGRLEWSDESCRIFGITREGFEGTADDFLGRIHPEDLPGFLPKRERALRGEGRLDAEYRILTPQGSKVIHQRAELDRHDADYLVGTLQDVTEQHAAADQLRRQQQLIDIAGRIARFGGWSADLASGTISRSDVVCDIHEVPRGTQTCLDEAIAFYTEDYRGEIRRLFERCVHEGEPFDTELELCTARGNRVWVRATGEAVRDRHGEVVRVQGAIQDITEFKRSRDERQRLSRDLRLTLDNIGEAFFTLNGEWRFTYANPEATRLLQRRYDNLVGYGIWECFPDLEHSPVGRAYLAAMRGGEAVRIDDFRYEPLSGWFDIRAYPTDTGLAVLFTDVSERHLLIQQLRDQEAEMRRSRDQLATALRMRQTLINSLPAHIALLAASGEIVDVNENWQQFASQTDLHRARTSVGDNYLTACLESARDDEVAAGAIANGLREVLAGSRDSFHLEYPVEGASATLWFRVVVNHLLHDAQHTDVEFGVVVMHQDITERKRAEDEMNRVAYHDPVTNVLSRNGFNRELGRLIGPADWMEDSVVVMSNLTQFRQVNDVHGYDTGDQVLRRLGERLGASAGERGVVGRVGGDGYMVYMEGARGQPLAKYKEQLMAAFREPVVVEGFPIEVAARFGCTRLGSEPRPVGHLLREAELALFQSTGPGPNDAWGVYTPALDAENRERMQLTRDLRRALQREEFELHYQPKVDMATGAVVAAEALIRWQHPDQGMISPARFIPVAEQSQLIGPIGDWVLAAACRSLSAWKGAGLDLVKIAVNVSIEQFRSGNFTHTVRETLESTGIPPGALSLEITESVFEREGNELQLDLADLRKAGIRLSLDDFGTGYSSLLYLQRYVFDEVKIDREFVNHMLEDEYSRGIVRMVIGVADMIGAEVVAEGVETAAERDFLLDAGCRIGQGYYYSPALPEEQFRALLEAEAALPKQ